MLGIPGEFGRQTVGFVTVTSTGAPGYLGLRGESHEVVLMHGVRFRPLRADEMTGQTDLSTEVWKLTAPSQATVLAAKSTGEILYDGTDSPAWDDDDSSNRFQIDGPKQPKPGMLGGVHHVTIMCKRQGV